MSCHPYDCRVSTSQAPRIGLTTYREPAAWGVWTETADLLPASYAAGVRAAGGVALLLPPGDPSTADVVLDGVHGLLLAGGADVDPARYGADRHEATGPARADRDEWELSLVHQAIARNMPVLAVCRGLQVLNVALGGDLRQHLPDDVGSDLHCPTVGVHGRHAVAMAAGSILAGVFGERAQVATYHHQSVDRLGADLVPTGWADDGVVEALELPGCAWVVGVQWHPEAHAGEALFDAFTAACVAQLTARAG